MDKTLLMKTKSSSGIIIFMLVAIIGYLIYDKISTKPTIIYQEQKQVAVEKSPVAEAQKVNHECLVAAENFFDKKRAENIDYYSATWNEYYQESSGICFVEIRGIIYNVNNGDIYSLVDNVLIKTSN